MWFQLRITYLLLAGKFFIISNTSCALDCIHHSFVSYINSTFCFSPIAASSPGLNPVDLLNLSDPMKSVDQLIHRQLAQMTQKQQAVTPQLLHQVQAPSPSPQAASNCIQCSLCGTILPSQTYMKHLREFHRVACSLESTGCPLCLKTVPLMVGCL